MAILSATATAGVGTLAASDASGSRTADLGSQDFLRLLIEQLRNQNPLDPVGGTDFLAQTAQFSSVENLAQLNSNLTQMLAGQLLSQASSLIGKEIAYVEAGTPGLKTAVVDGVNVAGNTLTLSAGGADVALAQVRSVRTA